MADEKVAEKAEYYKWLDLSLEERSLSNVPLTQDEYKKKSGVSRQTLIKWREKRPTSGDFNAQEYMSTHLEKILAKTIKIIEEKGSAKHIEMALKLMGLLIERKQETVKIEFTPIDLADIGKATIDGLRAEFSAGKGRCPVCGEYKLLCHQAYLDTEPEHTEDREVATVALSARPE